MSPSLLIDFIWHRAFEIPGEDKDKIRKDFAGAIIHWDEYGLESEYGWTIVPLYPKLPGNWMSMVPLHYQNAQSKGNDYPIYKTSLSSKDGKNVPFLQQWDEMQKGKSTFKPFNL